MGLGVTINPTILVAMRIIPRYFSFLPLAVIVLIFGRVSFVEFINERFRVACYALRVLS